MPVNTSFNLAWRPGSYWGGQELYEQLLATVTGTVRRRLIKAAFRSGRLHELDPLLTTTIMPAAVKARLAAVHPRFLAGEYLPDVTAGQLEIARIDLASTTGDVISVRVRPVDPEGDDTGNRVAAAAGHGFIYDIVDDYRTCFLDEPLTSARPLTLGELIEFMNTTCGAGMDRIPVHAVDDFLNHAAEGFESAADALRFVTVSSPFDLQLGPWAAAASAAWVARHMAGDDDEEDQDSEGVC